MKPLFDPSKSDWINIWAGDWSLLTCSHFGESYTKILKIEGRVFVQKAVLIIKEGKSGAYLDQQEKDLAGKYIASLYLTKLEKIKAICSSLKKETDEILTFLDKHKQKNITLSMYHQYWDHVNNYYLPHTIIKYMVDYLEPESLQKYLPHLQEARIYAEPVFKRTEEFMVSMSQQIAVKTKYNPHLILCMNSRELEIYFKSGKILEEEILKKRDQQAIILVKRGKEQIFIGKEAEEIEKLIIKPTFSDTIKGSTAYPGKVRGKVRIILNPTKVKDFQLGDILVTGMTRPEYLSLINQAAAIITDAGGILSHAAISARELKKPCVIGTKNATKVLKDGDVVEVDATKGTVRKIK